ncbi:hypothetical protein ACFL20_08130 [Spirochaetota bacterium]
MSGIYINRIILTFLLFLLSVIRLYPQKLTIQGEYKSDVVDYNDFEKEFYRKKIRYEMSRESSFNFAHIYINNDNENRFTWNLVLLDISARFHVILGNYTVSFGKGLLIGNNYYMSPDYFSSGIILSNSKPFKQYNSGNPVYSFNGIAAYYKNELFGNDLSVYFYYSRRGRYIDEDTYESSEFSYSLNSINNRDKRDKGHIEPVIIHDYGIMFKMVISENFQFMTYFIDTFVKNMNKSPVVWNYDEYRAMDYSQYNYGIERNYGWGIFTEYSDGFMNVFFEYGLVFRDLLINNEKLKTVYDYGMLFGVRLKHPIFSLSIIGKQAGREFYTIYSSGHNYPERSWIFCTSLGPVYKLTLGSAFSFEKKVSPGSTDTYLRVIKREKFFMNFKFTPKTSLNFDIQRYESHEEEDRAEKLQFKILASTVVYKILKSRLSSLLQKDNKSSSYAFGTDLTVSLLSTLDLVFSYSRFIIYNENNIYTIIKPINNSVASGFFVRESTNIVVAKLSFRYAGYFLAIRYEYQFLDKRPMQHQLEIIGRAVF